MNKQQLIAYPQDTTEPITYPTGELVLDLFKDEPIPLVLNIDDFTNVAEADASYSKSFEIPGTKNNNLFFNNIYNITSDSNFNPHKKTKIIVKEGTINTFEGYMQLNDILHKDGAITYDITLYSEAVNLKDILSDRVFRDLDFTELSHDYNETNIKNTWSGNLPYINYNASGFRQGSTVKYPLVRWNNISHYSSQFNSVRITNTSDFFRPFVKAKYLVQRIIKEAGYTFTSNFLSSTKFSKLFVDFNNATDINTLTDGFQCVPVNTSTIYGATSTNLDFTATYVNPISTSTASNYYDTSTDVFTSPQNSLKVNVNGNLYFNNPSGSTSTAKLVLRKVTAGGNVQIYTLFSGVAIADNSTTYAPTWKSFNSSGLNIVLDTNDTLQLRMQITGGDCLLYDNVALGTTSPQSGSRVGFAIESDLMNVNNIVANYRGDVNQWDFIKGFIDMFKLVITTDENNTNNLIIEPYKDWVDSGNLINLTNKVDDNEIKYSPIDGLAKKLIFKLKEDDKDYITINHNKPNEWKYSHNEINDIEIFDEVENEVEVKELSATYVTSILGSEIFAPQILDEDINDNWENKMRIMYDNGVQTLITDSYDNGADFDDETEYLLFTMVDSYPVNASTSNSYNFGVVNYQGAGGAVLNSLYNVYWLKYIDELYHKDTRIVKIEAYLTTDDISKIKFNDIILIKNKRFRIHKIEYRAGAMSKLELITIKDL
jgi:hypothetical protein